ncbi:glutathione S-transferase family protein [Hyalangium rubrum]|uniref:Glutathione S-transferase family protein n=1 Tax=Hyalangium rubrum TaxID=3103134 RepID=A0ABU5GUZ1_9BACT|nr:glutathione S-transferase family protein [Hyalangium sp. s54d21]MDY7224990.1 glutathione S-transferase family protein [Hyalangium sp. s54d21]
MPSPERTLYQFPISHYCEKARWLLDAKGLAYTLTNLMPGAHRRVTKRLAQGSQGSVPVLVDNGTALGDSTEIALYLERTYPSPALLPPPGPERDRVLELEDYFDHVAGVHVRRWAYGHIIGGGAPLGDMMFGPYPAPQRWLGRMMVPLIKVVLRRQYRIHPPKVEESRLKLLEGLDRLEREIGGDPSRYLVGSSLTIADITAAALYSPLVAPDNSPYPPRPDAETPKAMVEMRKALRDRPAGQWVLRRYEQDRLRPASLQSAA